MRENSIISCWNAHRPCRAEMDNFSLFCIGRMRLAKWREEKNKRTSKFVLTRISAIYFSLDHISNLLPICWLDQMCCHIFIKGHSWAFSNNSVFYDRQFRLINCHKSRSDFHSNIQIMKFTTKSDPNSFFLSHRGQTHVVVAVVVYGYRRMRKRIWSHKTILISKTTKKKSIKSCCCWLNGESDK